MSRRRVPGSVVVVVVLALLGCKRAAPDDAPKPAAAAPSTSVSVAASAQSAQPPEPSGYPAHKISSGWLEGGAWTEGYEIARGGGSSLDYAGAIAACTSAGRALCTDTQWSRACAADPALAGLSTWTASGVGGGQFIVRGGASCSARSLEDGAAHAPGRVALCCDRAAAIQTGNKNLAFIKATAAQLARYEKALRDRDTLALDSIYEEEVTFDGKSYPRAKLIQRHQWDFKAYPLQWMIFDQCEASIVNKDAEVYLQADCRTLYNRTGTTRVGVQRFLWGGKERRLVQVGAASTKKPAGSALEFAGEPEQTERVGVLLMAE